MKKIIPIGKLYSQRNPTESNDAFEIRVKLIMEYISKGGYVESLEVYKQGNSYIVGDGHHRYEALKRLCWKEVPCIVVFSK